MIKKSVWMIVGSSLVLSGCATMRFSPPATNIVNEMEVRGSNTTFSNRCRPQERRYTTRKATGNELGLNRIQPTAVGAITLANNFIYEFRCASHSAGNSRQAFEVPGLLAGIGSATALALGAGTNVAIGGAAATALADSGKDYYAPLTKAAIYGSALDAFLCIKSTAVGVQPFMINAQKAAGAEPVVSALATQDTIGASYFSPERRYFELVSTALFTTEGIAASRLRNSARYDAAGVIAQFEDKLDEIRTAESPENKDKNKAVAAGLIGQDGTVQAAATEEANTLAEAEDETEREEEQNSEPVVSATPGAKTKAVTKEVQAIATGLNQLDVLKPKLDLCILRAQL